MIHAAGLVPFTTIDFPGRLAAVIFLQGCPLRCPFCHNPALQSPDTPTDTDWTDIFAFLESRRNRLDGIVLSGGEPLMMPGITSLAEYIKSLGYQLAIHTSGVYPDRLRDLLPLIDWVGLDVKAPRDKYDLLTGRPHMVDKVWESLAILRDNRIDFEVRTTCDPRYLTIDDIARLGKELAAANVSTYVLQTYRTFDGDVNPPEESAIRSFFRDQALQDQLSALFPHYGTR